MIFNERDFEFIFDEVTRVTRVTRVTTKTLLAKPRSFPNLPAFIEPYDIILKFFQLDRAHLVVFCYKNNKMSIMGPQKVGS